MNWPPAGMELEVRAGRGALSRARFRPWVMIRTLFVYTLVRFGISCAGFVPQTYLKELVENSDFRKFDDGLKMTIDIDGQRSHRIEMLLENAAKAGIVQYGLHRQDAALITCFVPTPRAHDHIHFIDGAMGGYAMAASNLKAKMS